MFEDISRERFADIIRQTDPATSHAENNLLKKYLRAALCRAHYEILADDGTYYGEIPSCNGVYANAPTLEECREQLEEVLEEWVLFRVYKNLPLPVIDGLEIKIRAIA